MITKTMYILFHHGEDMTNPELVDLSEDPDWILTAAEKFMVNHWGKGTSAGPYVRECTLADKTMYGIPKSALGAWIFFAAEASLLWIEVRKP